MDNEFLASLVSVVSLWQSTERDGNPNVCLPIVKLEGLLLHLEMTEERNSTLQSDAAVLASENEFLRSKVSSLEGMLLSKTAAVVELELKLQATKVVGDAAMFQMRANAERMDTAEMRLDALREEG